MSQDCARVERVKSSLFRALYRVSTVECQESRQLCFVLKDVRAKTVNKFPTFFPLSASHKTGLSVQGQINTKYGCQQRCEANEKQLHHKTTTGRQVQSLTDTINIPYTARQQIKDNKESFSSLRIDQKCIFFRDSFFFCSLHFHK